MAPIIDHQAYCDAMQGSLEQKLFFLEHIPFLSTLLDYGCANGKLLDEAGTTDREPMGYAVNFGIYYDQDQAMLERVDDDFWKTITANEAHALGELKHCTLDHGPTGILFSSVLHELYSQQSPNQMQAFWQRIADTGVDYIIVRDMYWGKQGDTQFSEYPTAYCQFIKWLGKHCNRGQSQQLRDYNDYLPCGESTNDSKHVAEFLLKMPYTCNWERELLEAYFSVPDLRPILAELGYEVQLFEHHQVDHIQERIKADTGIDLPFNTHIKAIFKRVQPVLK